MQRNEVCPVCANETRQISKDGGDTWSCDLCMAEYPAEMELA